MDLANAGSSSADALFALARAMLLARAMSSLEGRAQGTVNLARISIVDTTLGESQAKYASRFSVGEQLGIALALQAAGIDAVETRLSAGDADSLDAARAVCQALDRTATIARCQSERDVEAAVRCGIEHVALSAPLSDRQIRDGFNGGRSGVLARLRRMIELARSHRLSVLVSGEDASRADLGFVLQALAESQAAGATRFRFVDTYGVLEPLGLHAVFRRLRAEAELALEFRGGDDLGLASANTVAAVRAGATHVSARVLEVAGAGGCARLADVVAALGAEPLAWVGVDPKRLPALADLIADVATNALRRGRRRRSAGAARAARCP